ncbi:hypothetical protein FSB76_24245 [Mucilaginibacter ginsenosidivorax]|uniref:Sigma-54 factor interaction domain-containing protein n=1 Tax=Mucilaginibacter ginsenosidivorax TaxID=862126 RepID=A0A5B8W7I5_9SPHI|nr:hypothetical protein [Mucilaginibacter ginsenosidivorax]QEC78906.1 hypothetical protein FSB76_24245 [Mucilaginibacter ginsenosidivorax]
MLNYPWPGNIRELFHLIERRVILSHTEIITKINLPDEAISLERVNNGNRANFRSIAEVYLDDSIVALKKCNGRISGKGGPLKF